MEDTNLIRYYSLSRPISIGTYPKSPINIVNFDTKQYVKEIDRDAWGYLEYNEKLNEQDISDYELKELINKDKNITTPSYYVIKDLSQFNNGKDSPLTRFNTIDDAINKFKVYKELNVDKSDNATVTLGASINNTELDILQVRNNKNYLVTDFTFFNQFYDNKGFISDLSLINDELGFDKVRIYDNDNKEDIDFISWDNPYISAKSNITFYVAESMEFTFMGEYHNNIKTFEEAVKIYNSIPEERLHGGKGIGFTLNSGSFHDGDFGLYENGTVDEETINSIKDFRENKFIQQAIKDAKKAFHIEGNNKVVDENIINTDIKDKEKSPKNLLMEKLQNGIKDVMDSENFKNWCKTSSKLYFNNYSFRNALLVNMQKPEASYVLGYEAWKRFGRQVVGKNTGIKILVPHFVREYEGKGSLLKYIKDNISSQFKKKPDLDYAHFNLKGTRLGFNGYKNGLYDVTLDNKSIKGHITEETLRKFLMQSVIGKVPTRYSVGIVFDVSNTITPEYIWLKNGFKKEDLALDSNGKPIQDKKGQYKVKNTPDRINSFNPTLDLTIKPNDTEKMKLLFSVLQSVSEKKGVPITIEQINEEGCKGFFSHSENRIAISDKLHITEKVATAFHEMAHADMHYLRYDIDRNMKEVQAEAVACMTASHFNIDTTTSSFNYLASWSSGRDLKELESSLSLIWNQSNKLMNDIEKELSSRNMNLNLESINVKDTFESDILTAKEYVSLENKRFSQLLTEAKNDLVNLSDQRQINIVKEQIVLCSNINNKLNNLGLEVAKARKSTNIQENIDLANKFLSSIKQIEIMKNKFYSLSMERIERAQEINSTLKEKYIKNPVKTLKSIKDNNSKLSSLNDADLNYIASSSYITKEFSKYLDTNPNKFIDNALKQLNNIKSVQSKSKTYVEVEYCEQWSDTPILKAGTVSHPKTINKIIEKAEKEIRKLKIEAEKKGDYYPYSKCYLNLCTEKPDGTIASIGEKLCIGDGLQKNLVDYLDNINSNREDFKIVVDNIEKSVRERSVKSGEKIIEPTIIEDNIDVHDENIDDKESLSQWKKEIDINKTTSINNSKEQVALSSER